MNKMNLQDIDYSDAMQEFFFALQDMDWEGALSSAIFIRDYENLPKSSPYDIDLIIDAEQQATFVRELKALASSAGLGVSAKQASGCCFVLIVDLNVNSDRRTWAFFEVRDKIKYTENFTVSSHNIVRKIHEGLKIPVPTDSWYYFLSILHSARNGKKLSAVQSEKVRKEIVELFSNNISRVFQFDPSSNQVEEECFRRLCKTIIQKKKKDTAHQNDRSKISHYVRRIYFLRRWNDLVFSLHGPDGVGKTTTSRLVEEMFNNIPIGFSSFHHITGWKTKKSPEKQQHSKGIEASSEDVSVFHKIARFIYRNLLPETLQNLYVISSGYHKYLSNLHAKIQKDSVHGRVVLVDRYIYDLTAKNLINSEPWPSVSRFFSHLMYPPKISFVLTDEPSNIRQRKQELTEPEIASYLDLMKTLVPSKTYEEVTVTNRTPEEIAKYISCQILEKCSPHLTYLLKQQKSGEF